MILARRGGLSGRASGSPAWPGFPRSAKCPTNRRAHRSRNSISKKAAGRHFFRHHERLFPFAGSRRPINALTLAARHHHLWTGLPVLMVVLLGGFTTNFIWCVPLNVKNNTGYQYFNPRSTRAVPSSRCETAIRRTPSMLRAKSSRQSGSPAAPSEPEPVPMLMRTTSSAPGRDDLVFPVLLLHHGRDPDGQIRFLQLDAAHGQHHHLQHALGYRTARVEGVEPADDRLGRGGPSRADRFYRYCRLWQLHRQFVGEPVNRILFPNSQPKQRIMTAFPEIQKIRYEGPQSKKTPSRFAITTSPKSWLARA